MMIENNVDELSARAIDELSNGGSFTSAVFGILPVILVTFVTLAVIAVAAFGWRSGWRWVRSRAQAEPEMSETEDPLFPDGATLLREESGSLPEEPHGLSEDSSANYATEDRYEAEDGYGAKDGYGAEGNTEDGALPSLPLPLAPQPQDDGPADPDGVQPPSTPGASANTGTDTGVNISVDTGAEINPDLSADMPGPELPPVTPAIPLASVPPHQPPQTATTVRTPVENYINPKDFSDTEDFSGTGATRANEADEEMGAMGTPPQGGTPKQKADSRPSADIGYTSYAAAGKPLAFSDTAHPPRSGHDSGTGIPVQNSRIPYIAPIVKADLRRADDRHDARFENLQSGMTSFQADLARQIDQSKAETHDRLDLMLQALDRKLEYLSTARADDTTAAAEPDLSPILAELQQISPAIARVTADIQGLGVRPSSQDDQDFARLHAGLETLQKSTDHHHADMVAPLATLQSNLAKSVENRISPIDDAVHRLEEKVSTLGAQGTGSSTQLNTLVSAMHDKIDRLQGVLDGHGQEVRATNQRLHDHTGDISELRTTVTALAQQMAETHTQTTALADNLRREEAEKNAIPAAQIALVDIVRETLDDGTYEVDAQLEEAGNVDCLVTLPAPIGAIAIRNATSMEALESLSGVAVADARARRAAFTRAGAQESAQVDTWAHSVQRESIQGSSIAQGGAGDILRRQLLQQITDISSTCIIPEKTAHIAMMYIPSEALYGVLHTHFEDIIKDSFRARVWIVSPATLTGALQSLKGIFARNPDTQRLAADLDILREDNTALTVELKSLRSKTAFLQEAYQTSQASLNALLAIPDEELKKINTGLTGAAAVQRAPDDVSHGHDGDNAEENGPRHHSTSHPANHSAEHPASPPPHRPSWPGFGAMGHSGRPVGTDE